MSLQLTIHADHSVLQIGDMSRQVDTAEAISAITQHLGLEKQNQVAETFRYPAGVAFVSMNGRNRMSLTCYYKGGERRQVRHATAGRKYNIVIPNIIVSHSLARTGDAWGVAESRYFATNKESQSALPAQLIWQQDRANGIWTLPMPNIYAESGRACYGGNSMPGGFKNNDLTPLHWYYEFLWNSSFNNDLNVPNAPMRVGHEWLNHLAGKDDFPYNELA